MRAANRTRLSRISPAQASVRMFFIERSSEMANWTIADEFSYINESVEHFYIITTIYRRNRKIADPFPVAETRHWAIAAEQPTSDSSAKPLAPGDWLLVDLLT